VRSYRAVSPLPAAWLGAGGLFSVALSLGLPRPAVSRHRVPVEPGLSSARWGRAAAVRPSGGNGDGIARMAGQGVSTKGGLVRCSKRTKRGFVQCGKRTEPGLSTGKVCTKVGFRVAEMCTKSRVVSDYKRISGDARAGEIGDGGAADRRHILQLLSAAAVNLCNQLFVRAAIIPKKTRGC
jgi:hypothetical protein